MSIFRQQSTERPEGWPRLLRDWKGIRLRSLRPIRTGNSEIPAGTLWTITQASRGLHLVSDPCPHCGIKMYVSGSKPSSFERVAEEPCATCGGSGLVGSASSTPSLDNGGYPDLGLDEREPCPDCQGGRDE